MMDIQANTIAQANYHIIQKILMSLYKEKQLMILPHPELWLQPPSSPDAILNTDEIDVLLTYTLVLAASTFIFVFIIELVDIKDKMKQVVKPSHIGALGIISLLGITLNDIASQELSSTMSTMGRLYIIGCSMMMLYTAILVATAIDKNSGLDILNGRIPGFLYKNDGPNNDNNNDDTNSKLITCTITILAPTLILYHHTKTDTFKETCDIIKKITELKWGSFTLENCKNLASTSYSLFFLLGFTAIVYNACKGVMGIEKTYKVFDTLIPSIAVHQQAQQPNEN